jgi:hypothetical protein
MRNVTLSADEALIGAARKRAESEHTTLNNLFREWLARYAGQPRLTADQVRQTVEAAAHFRVGRGFTREERNER